MMVMQNIAWQNGTLQRDITTGIAMAEDGSVVVVGHDRLGNAGFQAAKLDADGTLLWEWEVIYYLIGNVYVTSAVRTTCST